ncbi:MAG: hypothetical protein LBO69_02150 [Ignavibacteria bacterium]|jgi:hypothetical protein|nr:hypothetical protein [Ignavibacteria bacterium]
MKRLYLIILLFGCIGFYNGLEAHNAVGFRVGWRGTTQHFTHNYYDRYEQSIMHYGFFGIGEEIGLNEDKNGLSNIAIRPEFIVTGTGMDMQLEDFDYKLSDFFCWWVSVPFVYTPHYFGVAKNKHYGKEETSGWAPYLLVSPNLELVIGGDFAYIDFSISPGLGVKFFIDNVVLGIEAQYSFGLLDNRPDNSRVLGERFHRGLEITLMIGGIW